MQILFKLLREHGDIELPRDPRVADEESTEKRPMSLLMPWGAVLYLQDIYHKE